MSLTKKDKEEIRAIIREECVLDFGEKLMKSILRSPLEQLDKKWKDNGIKSESTGLIIAPEDVEIDGKTEFTWYEAMALEEEGKIPEGWRLPTRHEWVMIVEEFGQDADGSLNNSKFIERLSLKHKNGNYWSSTAYGHIGAYNLYLGGSSYTVSTAYPSNYDEEECGFSARCVKEIKYE